jgi:phage portal protein BeeE
LKPFRTLTNLFKKPEMSHNYVGAPSFAEVNPYGYLSHYESDAYSTSYPSVRAISSEFMTIKPFGIDANGKPTQHPAIDALYHPNQKDSSVAFFEKLAVSCLVMPKTYILVWRKENGEAKPGGNYGVGGKNIAGYTFIENPTISIKDRKVYYSIGSQTFTDKEVIVLTGGVDPYNLYGGYSPNIAAKRWATLDDYIADFQKGFFENNAIPAGHFIITAASQQDYKDTVAKLKEKHRGAGNNNNVTYTPRPIGQDGKPADAKIEWIPFAQSNKDIDFKNLFEQANKRVDMSYGVSQFIKGVDDAPNYATAQVSEKNFSKRAVYPLALRTYTQITHELNRITGGLGIAITFKYDIPIVADEEKVQAEKKNVEANIIRTMVLEGYSLDSIVDAFELSNGYKLLKKEEIIAVIENDKPDVDQGDEVEQSPDPSKIDGVTPLNIVKTKAELTDEQKIENVARTYMQAQIDRVAKEYKDTATNAVEPEAKEYELEDFIEGVLAIVSGILLVNGEKEYTLASTLLGNAFNVDELQGFTFTSAVEDAYRGYLKQVGTSYGQDTAEAIRKVLADASDSGLTVKETENALKNIMNTDEYRVKRLARTELNNSQAQGSLEGIKSIEAETGVKFEKSLDHSNSSSTPCEFCLSLDGKWYSTNEPFLSYGDSLTGINGTIYVNDWADYQAGDIHPNGKGAMIYRVVQ